MLKSLFYWQGVNAQGQATEGEIYAPSKTVASVLISRQGILIKKIKRLDPSNRSWHRTIKKREITTFFRQLATLLHANLPLTHALKTMQNAHHNHNMRQLIHHLIEALKEGFTFAQALQRHPKYFTTLFCNLISIAEQTSSLHITTTKIADTQEKLLKNQQQFILALTYPLLILFITIGLMIALCAFILPQFLHFYDSFQVSLPALTQILIKLSTGLQCYGLYGLMILLAIPLIIRTLYQHFKKLACYFDSLLLKIPLLGAYFEELIIIRISHTLNLSLSAGLPVTEALILVGTITNNKIYERMLMQIHTQVSAGRRLTDAMRSTQRFSTYFLEMIAIGEESGKLTYVLSQIVKQLEAANQNKTTVWSKLLEPTIMVILGLAMGALILALYLPIFQLGALL